MINQGDAFKILPTLAGDSVHAIITDPPYDLPKYQINWLIDEFCRISMGHILVFCKPENLWSAENYLFWVKLTSTKNFSKSHGRFVEMIAHVQKGSTFNQLFWGNMTGVYTDVLEGTRIHPYQKPLALMERLVLIHTNPDDTVLDPFAGCGTTWFACEKAGREFLGIEEDPQWVKYARDKIIRRS